MQKHLPEMLASLDAHIDHLLRVQVTEPGHPDEGGFVQPSLYHVEPRESGFMLSRLIIGYICRESRHFHSAAVRRAIELDLLYMQRHQRPDGCFDLSYCNFDSPPDTAFMINAVFNAWWLMEQRCDAETEWLKAPVLHFIETCCEGIAAGGFHTPNHRWAISACLKCAAKATGRQDFSDRADQYLNEGLDINQDGEFAERSSGNYNQVNDDQMLRLYIATGEKRFLEAARSNLRMMYNYIDPDDSVFTNNSTRQDLGWKVYTESYYMFFLLTGYFLKDPELGAAAEYMYQAAARHGKHPQGVEWLLLYPDLDGYGSDASFDTSVLTRYSRVFRDSDIARVRRDDYSYTLLLGKPNFLYFQVGAFPLYMVIYSNVCDRRHFLAETIEATGTGYRMTSHANSWYYKPFWPRTPETSDWWAMDNPHTRERFQNEGLDTAVTVTEQPDGIDVTIGTYGLDRVPFRVELGVLPCQVVGEQFILEGKAGECLTLTQGNVRLIRGEDVLTVGPGFAENLVLGRSTNAYPQSREHFTLYMTDYTPVSRTISIRAGAARAELLRKY